MNNVVEIINMPKTNNNENKIELYNNNKIWIM